MKRVTIDTVMSWGPCEAYTRQRVTKLFAGRKTVSALNILDMGIPDEDKIWAAVRASTKPQYVEFACQCAESVLPLYETYYPDGKRPRQCIDITRRYMAGDATKDELYTAAEAADAARAAAGAAEHAKQVDMLRRILVEGGAE